MFIIRFWAGLGNQMFEYAFYKKMCKVYNRNHVRGYFETDEQYEKNLIPLPGDTREYENLARMEMERVFGIKVPMASIGHVKRTSQFYPLAGKHYWLYSRLYTLRRYIWGDKTSYIQPEDHSEYYPEVFELSPLRSYYLNGVWVNEKYFHDIRDELLEDFTFHIDDDKNKELIKKIASENAVSVHFRSHQNTRRYYETGKLGPSNVLLEREYYEKAIEIIKEKVENPTFYVFSDSIEAAKKMFDGMIDYQLVDHNRKADAYKDMALMSVCKHNINGTGTFAFWGAYLNRNPDKIVITPQVPSDTSLRYNFSCEGWINL